MRKEKYCCDEATKRQYMNYYKEQAGHGLIGFQGTRFQRGHGQVECLKDCCVWPHLCLRKELSSLGKWL